MFRFLFNVGVWDLSPHVVTLFQSFRQPEKAWGLFLHILRNSNVMVAMTYPTLLNSWCVHDNVFRLDVGVAGD